MSLYHIGVQLCVISHCISLQKGGKGGSSPDNELLLVLYVFICGVLELLMEEKHVDVHVLWV
jgi:hypothetical protein